MQKATKALVIVVAILGITFFINQIIRDRTTPVSTIKPAAGEEAIINIDQEFSLVNETGEQVGLSSFDGYKLLFFGFTHCPDICPAGLQKITRTLELLGGEAGAVTPLFITVDPERDTPEIMKDYTAMFDDRIIGLTGSDEKIQEVVSAYKAYAAKSRMDEHSHDHGHGADETYMVDHSAYIYLLNNENDVIDIFGSDESAADIAESLKSVLN